MTAANLLVINIYSAVLINLLCLSQTYAVCHILTLSFTDLLCLPQTYSVCHRLTLSCHRLTLSVTDLLCLSQTYSACHRLTLPATDLLCLSQTYSVCQRFTLSCHRLTLSFTDILCLPQTYSVFHRLTLSVELHSTHSVLTHTEDRCHSLTHSVSFSPIYINIIKAWTVLQINPVNLAPPPPHLFAPITVQKERFLSELNASKNFLCTSATSRPSILSTSVVGICLGNFAKLGNNRYDVSKNIFNLKCQSYLLKIDKKR